MLFPCVVCACVSVCAISIVSSDFCFVRTFHSKCKSSIHCRRHFTFLSRVVFVPCPETSCVARSTVLYMHTYKNAHTHTLAHTDKVCFSWNKTTEASATDSCYRWAKTSTSRMVGKLVGWPVRYQVSLFLSLTLSVCSCVCVCVCVIEWTLNAVQHSVRCWPWWRLPFVLPCKCQQKHFSDTNPKGGSE